MHPTCKRHILALSVLCIVASISGCQKQNSASIIGTWKHLQTTASYPSSTMPNDTFWEDPSSTISFSVDHSFFETSSIGVRNGTYTLNGDHLSFHENGNNRNPSNAHITILTDHLLQWETNRISANPIPITIYTHTLTR
jgi:hypothetical protein